MLQKHVNNLKRWNEELQKIGKHEQSGRHLCLRTKRLRKKTKEDANDVLNQVRDLLKDAEAEIPDVQVHRISKDNNDVIVRFITFRYRTLFYHNRKKLKTQSMHLNYTKSRLPLLNEARNLIENNEDLAFCYADINCRCKLRFKYNDELFFKSVDVFKSKLSYYSNDSNE